MYKYISYPNIMGDAVYRDVLNGHLVDRKYPTQLIIQINWNRVFTPALVQEHVTIATQSINNKLERCAIQFYGHKECSYQHLLEYIDRVLFQVPWVLLKFVSISYKIDRRNSNVFE
jgi:hypothetical protein